MLRRMTPRERLYLTAIMIVTAVAAVLEYSHQAELGIFLGSGLALAGLAWLVSFATEALGERFSPAGTGVMQSTLGNLPALLVVLFALKAGETTVAQASILGSLFAKRAARVGVRPGGGRVQGARRRHAVPARLTTRRPWCCSRRSSL